MSTSPTCLITISISLSFLFPPVIQLRLNILRPNFGGSLPVAVKNMYFFSPAL